MLGYIRKKDAPEVIYYKDSRRSYNCVVGIGDYLFKGNKIDNTLDSVLKYWSGRNTCAAIINRKNVEDITLINYNPLSYIKAPLNTGVNKYRKDEDS